MRAVLTGLSGLALSICVLFAAWGPVYRQLDLARWSELAIAAAIGLGAGALARRETPAWLAWIVLVVLAWAAYIWAIFNLLPGALAPPFLVYPLAASVGVAAGLIARHMPSRARALRLVPIVICAAAVTGLVYLEGPLATWGQSTRRQAPAFTLQLSGGGQVSSQALRGRTVVLAFWATWCKPCRKELPALQRLYNKHYAGRDDVKFYLVNEDRGPAGPERAEAWLRHYRIKLASVLDTNGVLGRKLNRANVLPVRIVIGPRGLLHLTDYGYMQGDAGFPDLRAAIAEAVKK